VEPPLPPEDVPQEAGFQTIDCEPPPPDLIGDAPVSGLVDDELCPYRARHLLEEDMWKTCRPCRATVERVLVHLARAD
jgi:hypothetical protein